MPIIQLDSIGALGIVKDIPDYELPPEAISNGKNVRFLDGALQQFLGHAQFGPTLAEAPIWLLSHQIGAALYWITCSAETVYANNGVTVKDISRTSGGSYNASLDGNWNGGVFNGVPVLNNGTDEPQQWDSDFVTPGPLVPLSNWKSAGETTLTAKLLLPFNEYLMAFNVTEDGTEFPDVFRWSAPALPGAVPPSWDYNSPSAGAGRRALSGTPGGIVAAHRISSGLMIYKEVGVYSCQWVGGNQIFRTDQILGNLGVFGQYCVSSFDEGNQHVILSNDADIIVHNGRDILNTAKRRVQRWIRQNIDETKKHRSFVIFFPYENEVWVCFPEVGSEVPNLAIVWNMRENVFGVRDLPNAAFGSVGIGAEAASAIWDANTVVWDSALETWSARGFGLNRRHLVLAGHADSKLYEVDSAITFAGAAIESYAERTGLALVGRDRDGSWKSDITRRKYLREMIPKIEGGPVEICAYAQELQNGPVSIEGPYTFDPATDRSVPFHISGRLLGYKIAGTSPWKLHGLGLNISVGGA